MAWTPDREALAWAAGFFDGEGSTYLDPAPRLTVVQNHPAVLERFADAVGGLGAMHGGTKIYGRAKKPVYQYRISGFAKVQAALAMLWPFLSEQKREQALAVLRRYHAQGSGRPRRHSPSSPACGSPHPATRVRDCRACKNAHRRNQLARTKVA